MWRVALERGLAGLVAKQLLASRVDMVFAPIERSGALKPEQLAKLKAELTANLRKAEAEGAPYLDVASSALGEVASRWPELKQALAGVGKVALDAAQSAASTARTEVRKTTAESSEPRVVTPEVME